MHTLSRFGAPLCLALLLGLPNCSATSEDVSVFDDLQPAANEAALTPSAKELAGTYRSPKGAGLFSVLVLREDGTYSATLQDGTKESGRFNALLAEKGEAKMVLETEAGIKRKLGIAYEAQSSKVVDVDYPDSAEERDPIFTEHPQTSSFVSSNNYRMKIPFHAYDADATIVFGSADYAKAAAMMAPHNLIPVRTSDGQAIASIWLMNYKSTSLGPYFEVVFGFAANTVSKTITIHSNHSFLAPMMDPKGTLFSSKLLLPPNKQDAIDWGREVGGWDKSKADSMDFDTSHLTASYEIHENGALGLRATIERKTGALAMGTSVLGILSDLGGNVSLGNVAQSLIKDVTSSTVVTSGVPGFEKKKSTAYFRFKPTAKSWNRDTDKLELGSSPFGKLIQDLKFDPRLVTYAPHMQGVMTSAK